MTNTPRLGIVGLGAQGSVYAQLISDGLVPNMDLGAICDGNPATRQLVESKFPAAVFYDDYLTMLDSGSVDAVVICVPSYLHPQMGIDALLHGIHVLLEKPAGVYTKQVEELNAVAASKPELTFAIMFNQRNNPLYRRIKEIISSGEIGAIRHTSWIITTSWRPQAYYDQSACTNAASIDRSRSGSACCRYSNTAGASIGLGLAVIVGVSLTVDFERSSEGSPRWPPSSATTR